MDKIKIKERPIEEQRDYLLEQNMLLTGKIATLEKENAKLRKTNTEVKKSIIYCNRVYNDNLDYSHHIEEQLTKAKEIIKKLVNGVRVLNDPKVELTDCDGFLAEAEQFLKDCEVEK